MPCIGTSRAGAGGSTRLSIATSLWPAPLRCIGERSAGICCGPRPICFSRGRRSRVKLLAWAARRAGMERVAAWLAGRRLLLRDRGRARDRVAGGNRTARNPVSTARSGLVSRCDRRNDTRRRESGRTPRRPGRRRPRFSPPACRRSRDLSRVAHRDGRDRNRLCRRRSRCSGRQTGDPGSGDLELGSGGDDRTTDGDRRLSARRQSRWVVVQPVSGCRRSRTARRHDRRRVPRRRHAGRLFRRSHRSLAAPARACIGEGSSGFCGSWRPICAASRVEIGSCATIMSPASSIFST